MYIVSVTLLLLLVGSAMYVAAALGILGFTLSEMYSSYPLLRGIGELTWGASTDFVLLAVPMFVMMGELLLRSGVTEAMYKAFDKWLGHIPGGLMHANIAACAMFSATSGSSVATAATIGTVSIPNMRTFNYSPPLFLGSIAAGGTLGILIPPSINMILYGVLSDTSVADLYLAAFIPGALLAGLFFLTIWAICWFQPSLSGGIEKAPLEERISTLIHLVPPMLLFMIVVGSIYLGWATPTEAAALGVVASLLYALAGRKLTFQGLLRAFEGTVRTTSMVMLIVIAALFVNFVFSTIGFTSALVGVVNALDWSPVYVMLAIVAIYLLLGCFVETLTLMIATTPIVVPIIINLGYDPVWFGVVFVMLIEAALITPPIGMNLFVVQSVRGSGPFRDVIVGSLPFLIMIMLAILLLIGFPDLALWLPSVFAGVK